MVERTIYPWLSYPTPRAAIFICNKTSIDSFLQEIPPRYVVYFVHQNAILFTFVMNPLAVQMIAKKNEQQLQWLLEAIVGMSWNSEGVFPRNECY